MMHDDYKIITYDDIITSAIKRLQCTSQSLFSFLVHLHFIQMISHINNVCPVIDATN